MSTPTQLKALIFDVDGTMYRQGRVRRAMVWRLLRAHVTQPHRGLLTLRVLHAYRRAQEVMRALPKEDGDLAERQLLLASKWTGVSREVVRSCVGRWMEQEPLEIVARSRREGLLEFLSAAIERGLRLGVFSDYPPDAKLAAMGIAHLFDVTTSAQDPDVQQFKPSSRGLEVTIHRLGVGNHEALYVGDRPEIDALAASGAAVACAIMGRPGVVGRRGWFAVSDYRELKDAIFCQ